MSKPYYYAPGRTAERAEIAGVIWDGDPREGTLRAVAYVRWTDEGAAVDGRRGRVLAAAPALLAASEAVALALESPDETTDLGALAAQLREALAAAKGNPG